MIQYCLLAPSSRSEVSPIEIAKPPFLFMTEPYRNECKMKKTTLIPIRGKPVSKPSAVSKLGLFNDEEESKPQVKSSLSFFSDLGDDKVHSISVKIKKEEEGEEDELDAFMSNVTSAAQSDMMHTFAKQQGLDHKESEVYDHGSSSSGKDRDDAKEEEEEDVMDIYIHEKAERESDMKAALESDKQVVGEDGKLIDHLAKPYELLQPVDHASIEYPPFKSNFYIVDKVLASLSEEEVDAIMDNLGIFTTGPGALLCPLTSFVEAGLPDVMMSAIQSAGFEKPTPIQAAALPFVLSGRDTIGIASTGSGKTMAFMWPLLVHIRAQKALQHGDGPIGLVIAPTRELVEQIHKEAKYFAKFHGTRCVALTGGSSKWQQQQQLSEVC